MKYWRTTVYTPENIDDTEVVYLQAPNEAELLIVALDTHAKPVLDLEEITQSVYNANI